MTFSQTAFVNCSLQLCFFESSCLFCSPSLIFRENLESLDYPGILADKALRWVLSAVLSPQFQLEDLITPWLELPSLLTLVRAVAHTPGIPCSAALTSILLCSRSSSLRAAGSIGSLALKWWIQYTYSDKVGHICANTSSRIVQSSFSSLYSLLLSAHHPAKRQNVSNFLEK